MVSPRAAKYPSVISRFRGQTGRSEDLALRERSSEDRHILRRVFERHRSRKTGSPVLTGLQKKDNGDPGSFPRRRGTRGGSGAGEGQGEEVPDQGSTARPGAKGRNRGSQQQESGGDRLDEADQGRCSAAARRIPLVGESRSECAGHAYS